VRRWVFWGGVILTLAWMAVLVFYAGYVMPAGWAEVSEVVQAVGMVGIVAGYPWGKDDRA
jgi:hypothetical protein